MFFSFFSIVRSCCFAYFFFNKWLFYPPMYRYELFPWSTKIMQCLANRKACLRYVLCIFKDSVLLAFFPSSLVPCVCLTVSSAFCVWMILPFFHLSIQYLLSWIHQDSIAIFRYCCNSRGSKFVFNVNLFASKNYAKHLQCSIKGI